MCFLGTVYIIFASITHFFQAPPALLFQPLEQLIKYTRPLITTDVERARAFYVWLSTFGQTEVSLSVAAPQDTPLFYMRMIEEGQMDHNEFYTLLCRFVSISSHMVHKKPYVFRCSVDLFSTNISLCTISCIINMAYISINLTYSSIHFVYSSIT